MAKEQNTQSELMRIMGTDIRGHADLVHGFSTIKGIGFMFSNAMCVTLKFDKSRKISSLTEKEIEKVEEFLSNPVKEGMPEWLLNRRNDIDSGDNLHYVSKDIDYNLIQLKRKLGKMKTYKGLRHRAQLTLRGQRTKSNFRRNKTLSAMKSKSGGKK